MDRLPGTCYAVCVVMSLMSLQGMTYSFLGPGIRLGGLTELVVCVVMSLQGMAGPGIRLGEFTELVVCVVMSSDVIARHGGSWDQIRGVH